MASQIYDSATIFLSQVMLAECRDVQLTHVSNAQEIITMVKGFAGISPGAKMARIQLTEAIPRAGIELDFIGKLQGDEEVEIVLFRGGKKVKTKGFITECQESFSADNPSSFNCTIVASPVSESTF